MCQGLRARGRCVGVLQGPGRLGGLLGAEGCTAETSVFTGVFALPRGGR